MPKEDLRRYTIEQIREMNRKGDVVPTAADAPEYEGDDAFWAALEETVKDEQAGIVKVAVKPETLAFFKSIPSSYASEMSRVLDDYAAAQAKKRKAS